jgi:hypothetical protein
MLDTFKNSGKMWRKALNFIEILFEVENVVFINMAGKLKI